jgi:hypothetical protein
MANHADSSDFVVRISLSANTDGRVVINGVPIGAHAGLSIIFVVASCLTIASNVVSEFLRPRWNSKLMVIMRRSSSLESGAQDRRLLQS